MTAKGSHTNTKFKKKHKFFAFFVTSLFEEVSRLPQAVLQGQKLRSSI